MARGPRALRPVGNQPTAHRARARWRTWRGCLRGQRGARSTPHRSPRLFFTNTAIGRLLRLQSNAIKSFESRAERPARGLPCGEPAIRPRSTRALADLAWLFSGPTRGALHPTPLAEALIQRHSDRSAAAASNCRNQSFQIPWRAARTRFASWRTGHPPTEHARAGKVGVVVSAANAGCAPPPTVCRGSSSPTPRQVGCCGCYAITEASEFRGARPARASPSGIKPTTYTARALADLA